MPIKICFIKDIRGFGDVNFLMPNSVQISESGKVIVCDGGNDRICVFDEKLNEYTEVGKRGYSKYRFLEPVGAFVDKNENTYVMDWHNHRVVILDKDLVYHDEFGLFSSSMKNASIGIVNFIKIYLATVIRILRRKGSYLRTHFKTDNERVQVEYSILKRIAGVGYFTKLYLKKYLGRAYLINDHSINKPNGICLMGEKLVLSQKNFRCITVFSKDKPFKKIENIKFPFPDMEFGRLGNVTWDDRNKLLYVCDERNEKIWVFDRDLKYLRCLSGEDSGQGKFLPFAITLIEDRYIGVCGGYNFQIIDPNTGQIVFKSHELGELHGICYATVQGVIYVANRSQNLIHCFKLIFDK